MRINLYILDEDDAQQQPSNNIIDKAISGTWNLGKDTWNSMTDQGKLYTKVGAGAYVGSKLLIGQDYFQAVRQYLRLHPTNPVCQFILEHPHFTAMAGAILLAANYKSIGLGLKNFLINHGIMKGTPTDNSGEASNG